MSFVPVVLYPCGMLNESMPNVTGRSVKKKTTTALQGPSYLKRGRSVTLCSDACTHCLRVGILKEYLLVSVD